MIFGAVYKRRNAKFNFFDFLTPKYDRTCKAELGALLNFLKINFKKTDANFIPPFSIQKILRNFASRLLGMAIFWGQKI